MFKIMAWHRHILLTGVTTLGVFCLVATSAIAQVGPPPPETKTAEVAEKANPQASKWKEELTVGAQIDDGRANTRAVTVSGAAWAKYGKWIVRFDAAEAYGTISIAGNSIVSIDRQYGTFSFSRDFTKTIFFTQINSLERDTILLIDYRASSMNAIGVRTKKGKVAFDFGPGITLVDQQKNTPEIDGAKLDAGGFYSLVYDVAPNWQITHWATYRNDVSYARDRLIDSSAAITGKITKVIGMRVAVTYNYEGVLSAGALKGFATKNYLTTTIGVTIHH